MEFYLQYGYGMKSMSEKLVEQWGGGTVILSPRDSTPDQLVRTAHAITALNGGRVLLDPQFFLPHSDHEKLCSHDFWPDQYQTNVFWQGPELTELLTKLFALNQTLGTHDLILPGLLATEVTEDWLETERAVIEEARALNHSLPVLTTIALAADACRDVDQINTLLESAENWETDGYYIVCEHTNQNYFVEDPIWLANVLDLVAGLRLLDRRVIVGYCNQQMLVTALAKPSAIASGNYMNVRAFPPDKFYAPDDEVRQKAVWYYCPQALSEYKIPFLDIAKRRGVLDQMAPPAALDGGYATVLFSGAEPSTVDFGERAAFLHYLHALRGQVLQSTHSSFDETYTHHEQQLDSAEALLAILKSVGVRGQQRDFSEIVDVNRAAINDLASTRGATLRHRWGDL